VLKCFGVEKSIGFVPFLALNQNRRPYLLSQRYHLARSLEDQSSGLDFRQRYELIQFLAHALSVPACFFQLLEWSSSLSKKTRSSGSLSLFAHLVDFEQLELGAAGLALNMGVFALESNPEAFNGFAFWTRLEVAGRLFNLIQLQRLSDPPIASVFCQNLIVLVCTSSLTVKTAQFNILEPASSR
jgi:hypothetical protein